MGTLLLTIAEETDCGWDNSCVNSQSNVYILAEGEMHGLRSSNSRDYLLIISRERLDTLAFWVEVPAEASPFKLVCTYMYMYSPGLGRDSREVINSPFLHFCCWYRYVCMQQQSWIIKKKKVLQWSWRGREYSVCMYTTPCKHPSS